MGYPVGIDLGTTNSVVAVYGRDSPRVIRMPSGERYLPSAAGVDPLWGLVPGEPARFLVRERPDATILSVKRFMGTEHTFVLGDEAVQTTCAEGVG